VYKRQRGLGDVYKRQPKTCCTGKAKCPPPNSKPIQKES
jgi:hypothetical protein